MGAALEVLTGPLRDVDFELVGAAFEGCPEGLAIVEEGRILYANLALARLLGYDEPGKLTGMALGRLRPRGCECTRLDGSDAARTSEGYPLCEFASRRANGASVLIEATCSSFRHRDREMLVIIARDISLRERRRGMRDSQRQYRAIINAAPMGIVQCAQDGAILQSNPAVEQLVGLTAEELRDRKLWEFIHPDHVSQEQRLFQEMVEGKRDSGQLEVRYLGKQANAGWMRLTLSRVHGRNGQPEFVLGMMEDVTDRKRAEEQLREAQKMEAIGRLVGGVAHDFNNLLTGIMLYCDLLITGLAPESRGHHHAEEIRLAAEQGAALIQQLLAIARQQVIEPRVLCLNEVITRSRNLLARLIGESIEIETVLAEDLGWVKMDPAQVQQILFNLVLNARDAMPEGGRITVSSANAELLPVGAALPRDPLPAVMLAVSDTGCGMSPETRAHLFEPFFTSKQPGRGNGLGLVTVHNIVRNNRGAIEVESEPGRGTTLRILLPQLLESRMPAPAEESFSPAAGGETVLLLEDNVTVREAAQRLLSECGYHVLEAATGQEALAVASRHSGYIHLLLADLAMPGMSGRDVARHLCAQLPGLKTLFMSGYEPQNCISEEEEPVVVFHKPFTGALLLQKVREILDTSQTQKSETMP